MPGQSEDYESSPNKSYRLRLRQFAMPPNSIGSQPMMKTQVMATVQQKEDVSKVLKVSNYLKLRKES